MFTLTKLSAQARTMFSLDDQKGFTVPRFAILILIIIVGAVAIGVYLLNNPQIFRSRAGTGVDWLNAFNITNASDQVLVCNNTQNPPICETNTLTVKVAVKDLSVLTKSVLAESTGSATESETEIIGTKSAILVPVGSIAPSGGVLSIKVRDQDIDFNTKKPVTIILSTEDGAALLPVEYDIPIVVTREDNSIQALVIKFNYRPGSTTGGDATSSASPRANSTASASATPRAAGRYDLNGDGVLNSFDTASFLQKWRGKNTADLKTIDFNNDGVVNIFDFSTMIGGLSR